LKAENYRNILSDAAAEWRLGRQEADRSLVNLFWPLAARSLKTEPTHLKTIPYHHNYELSKGRQ
jgi:hypothetical protein